MILLFLYQCVFILLCPIWLVVFLGRLCRGKEDKKRWKERLGWPGCSCPKGKLIWMHGASVGECLSMLSLIHCLLDKDPDLHIMVTSGTVTSAKIMQERLPKRAFHHYLPIDAPGFINRLIHHFHPAAVFWFESEFWPTTLWGFKKEKVPLILLNGRISDRSFARWKKHPYIIRHILSCFTCTLGQSEEDRCRLEKLGSLETACVGNIKCAAKPSPFTPSELKGFLDKIGHRPVWVMASTHAPEEEMMVQTILQLKQTYPNLLTICAPRHPNRADDLKQMFQSHQLQVVQRSKKESLNNQTDIYLADTLGEMGLIYQLAPIVFVGGSLINFGGQNMLEPMYWSRVVCVGPYTQNFRAFMKMGKEQKTVIEVKNALELAEQISYYWGHPKEQKEMSQRAHKMAISQMAVLDRLYVFLQQRKVV